MISDDELLQRVEGEDPVHRLSQLLYDKYMSVPEEYKPYIEKITQIRQFSVNRG